MAFRRPFRRLALGAVTATAVFFACDSNPTAVSGPGELHALVVSPNGPEGAAVLELRGAGLGTVSMSGGYAFGEPSAGSMRLVVVLNQPGDIAFTISVDDVGNVPTATIVEVSDGANQLRASSAGYTVEFTAR